ncbi:hypothetical protein CLV43_106282 [Umezawaea tangerina]|uniref:Uncharacterized protein n=1 Tax=Umezawaea tangerina TaxID=84725 RepID=A0A2T0T4D1_9PSEU|nr:hypothetical protein CLV43_106282 [Umezawaea tangerina]
MWPLPPLRVFGADGAGEIGVGGEQRVAENLADHGLSLAWPHRQVRGLVGLHRVHALWVVQSFDNKISRFRLSGDLRSGTLEKEITSPAYGIPATAARFSHLLAAVNAHSDTRPTPQDPVLAENYVRAGQAAWWYSLRMPPSRCRRRTSKSVIWAWSVIGGGSGCSGRALAMPWWGRWVL